MKAVVYRNLNDIVSLTVLTLMAVALIAGQAKLVPAATGSDSPDMQIRNIRHNGE